jgi:predicted ABC-type ATPase
LVLGRATELKKITGLRIIETVSPEISSHKIIIPETVLSQTKGIRRMIPEMT